MVCHHFWAVCQGVHGLSCPSDVCDYPVLINWAGGGDASHPTEKLTAKSVGIFMSPS